MNATLPETTLEIGTATTIGSMPGTDPLEAARIVVGELPALTPIPELPARGIGADFLGRTAGLLVDLAVEVVPSGYRVSARPGRDEQRAVDLLRWDLDAMEQAVVEAGTPPKLLKVRAAGPWTLAAGVELHRGHRVLTDHGALRDFAESLTEGLIRHVQEASERTGSPVLVQLDEPSLPAVLSGDVPTPSDYGTVPAVPEPEAQAVLSEVVGELATATGNAVAVSCHARQPPVGLLRRAGAGTIALDATDLQDVSGVLADQIGEAWDAGLYLFLGLVPNVDPSEEATVRQLASPAFELASRLGFPRRILGERGIPTPVGGLADASPTWARRAITLARDLGRAFAEEGEG